MIQENCIDSWDKLASVVEEFKEASSDDRWIFRGVSKSEYLLIPRSGREKDSHGTLLPAATLRDGLMKFVRESFPHLSFAPHSPLEWMTVAQHHGFPTSLLDWTESPLVAAYFAVRAAFGQERRAGPSAIYAIRRPKLIIGAPDDYPDEPVVAYYPRHCDSRIVAQRGLFTHHADPYTPYDPAEGRKWDVCHDFRFELRKILDVCGLNESTLFPDIDGLARHIVWALKWKRH